MAGLEEYTVVCRPDDNGTFLAHVPAIDGCHAWGKTPDEARVELADVFEMIREEFEEEARALPHDVDVVVGHVDDDTGSRWG